MNIKLNPSPPSKTMKCWKLGGGRCSPAEAAVIVEKEFTIFLDGARLAAASIIPGFEKEFVVGYLYGQGFIDTIADIKSLETEDLAARVTLKTNHKTAAASPANYRIVSGGGGSAYHGKIAFPEIKPGLKINRNDIFTAMNTLFNSASLYAETKGAHAAGLFSSDARPLCLIEDIGRHNTLDKAIGFALLNQIDCGQTFLVSTGRMASEMVTKICRAGIPLAATKTAITDKGLAIAKRCGLTLIGFVRDTGNIIYTDMDVRIIQEAGMKIYSCPARVLCE